MRLALVLALVLAASTVAEAAPLQELRIVVKKGERRLYLYEGPERLVKTYRIALGAQPAGPKTEEGDGATPEGEYYVTHGNPKSKFHLSLGLSYPNVADADRGAARGVITSAEQQTIAAAIRQHERPPQHTRLGGDVFVHGGGTTSDWTAGCIALADEDIDELFTRVPVRTRVTILP
jgi:murein L,D-transpeptidase YafK